MHRVIRAKVLLIQYRYFSNVYQLGGKKTTYSTCTFQTEGFETIGMKTLTMSFRLKLEFD